MRFRSRLIRWLVAHQGWYFFPILRLVAHRWDPPGHQPGLSYTRTSLWQSYRIVIGYLNTVGLRGKDPFLCPLVAQRRAL
jgi:hypothetical protein